MGKEKFAIGDIGLDIKNKLSFEVLERKENNLFKVKIIKSLDTFKENEITTIDKYFLEEDIIIFNPTDVMFKEIFGEENKEIKADNIKPSYYHKGKVDTIKFCLENDLDFLQGNVVKYVVRYKEKNGLEDLNKAKEYLDRLIKNELEKSMKEAIRK